MNRWTETEKNTVVTMWQEDFSAADISAALKGRHTRNSVIGLVHRLQNSTHPDLRKRNTPVNFGINRRRLGRPRRPSDAAVLKPASQRIVSTFLPAPVMPIEPPLAPTGADAHMVSKLDGDSQKASVTAPFDYRSTAGTLRGVSLLRVGEYHCRWILPLLVGNDGHKRCCGERIQNGSSYCAQHTRSAWAKTNSSVSAENIKTAITSAPVIVDIKPVLE